MARGRDEANWRRRTARFSAGTILLGLVLALAPFAAPGLFHGRPILRLPAATFMMVVGMPLVLLALAALFARWQLAIDRHYDVSER